MGCLKLTYDENPSPLFVSANNFGGTEKRGLEWNSFELRNYDAVIGRWTSVDPAQYIGSPYAAMGNNPLLNIDIRGDTINVYSNSDPDFGGDILFSLDDGINGVRNMTTSSLYDAGWQWTSPDAANYATLMSVNRSALAGLGTKFFTVGDIISFTNSLDIDGSMDMLSYWKGGPGDWKASSNGANGAYLVFLDKRLYWSDQVGQLSFSISMQRMGYSGPKTLSIGNLFGSGYPNPFTNDYGSDQDWIMRGYMYSLSGRSIHRSVRKGSYTYSQFQK